jgi:hypothetical protein
MKLYKLLCLSALLVLLAAPAFSANTKTAKGHESGPVVTLFEIKQAEATLTDTCLNVTEVLNTTDSVACENYAVNYFIANQTMRVTNLRTVVGLAGDGTYTCTFNIEVGGAEPVGSADHVTTVDALAGAVENTAQNFIIERGDAFAIHVENGVKCGTGGTLKPSFAVQLEGYFLDTPGATNAFTPSAVK